MVLEVAQLMALAAQCAPTVAPETLLAVARAESSNNPYAIGVNDAARLARQPQSKPEAVQVATRLLREGRNIDLGLGQINSKNLNWLGLSVEDAFEPCRNLAASAKVLEEGYRTGLRHAESPQGALRIALSLYNTGDVGRGFRNGYVAKVERSAGHVVPAISTAALPAAATVQPARGSTPVEPPAAGLDASVSDRVEAAATAAEAALQSQPQPAKEQAPAWDVFARHGRSRHVFSQ